ncbi:MAG: hypothetical protein WKF96_24675 [Solirubrobacteraceae bacterium]
MIDHTDHMLQQALRRADVPESLHFRHDHLENIRRLARRRGRTRVVGGLVGLATFAFLSTAVASTFSTPDQDWVTSPPSQEAPPPMANAQPSPWSDTPVAEDSDGAVFSVPGIAYLIERGSIGELMWTAASGKVSEPVSCVFVKGDELFATMQADCFDSWDGTELANWTAFRSDRAEQGTVFVGAADTTARQVVITFDDGSRQVVDAVASPTSAELRFFAFSSLEAVAVRTVIPVDGDGVPAAPPRASRTPPCEGDCPPQPSQHA